MTFCRTWLRLIGLGRTRASFDPFVPRPRIAFKPGLIAKENLAGRTLQEFQELEGEGLARESLPKLRDPEAPVRGG